MKADRKKPETPKRPPLKQPMPVEIINELLGFIRNQFYPDASDSVWGCDAHFIKVRVLLWPARFMVDKGFTVTAHRYQEILKSILVGIQRHGDTSAITHLPRYLTVCVQRHFDKNWETYYNEAKSTANQMEAAILGLKAIVREEGPNAVEVMAATQRLMTAPKKRQAKATVSQGELLL